MDEILTKTIVCCANHDHATAEDCEIGAKEVTIPLNEQELAEHAERIKMWEEEKELKKIAEEAREIAKASAKAKLTALGLTEEEIAAL